MKSLRIADDLALPLDACTQTFAWIGRKRSGKTYGSGKLVEEFLRAHVQVVILDTVGNWYGLRLAADGKTNAYDVPVFGGLRQDLPLLPTAGAVVADVVVDTGRSVILDVSQFNFSDRKKFAADFGTRLWQRKKGENAPTPIHLILEECQLIVPQFVGKDETRMVHVYEEIVRLGGNYGIGVSMLTQRPQSVNKEVLTQAECIMAFQINGVPERKALREWLTYEGGDVNLVNELPSLPVGTCYLWSPQWLKTFRKVTIGKKSTFDASATPKMGHTNARRNPAPLDLHDIELRMADTIEKAKADDPRELKRTIMDLQRQLRLADTNTSALKPVITEIPVLPDATLKHLDGVIAWLSTHVIDKLSVLTDIRDEVIKTCANIKSISQVNVRRAGTRVTNPSMNDPRHPLLPAHLRNGAGSSLGASRQRILNALSWAESIGLSTLPKIQLALLADQSPTSGGYFNNLGHLRTMGLIDYPGASLVALTENGRRQAEPVDVPTTSEELQGMLYRKLSDPQARILRTLIAQYPQSMNKDILAESTGQSPTSGGYFNNLGRLRSLGLIDYPQRGMAAANRMLFLERH